MSRRQASKFIEDVRSSRVRHPTQPGFSIASWRRAFESAEDDSVDAQRLFDAGLWTFQQLERVRSELATAGLKPTTKDETIRLLVGLTNYIARRAAADVLKRSPNEYFVAAVTANAADDIIETVLDGVRYPLAAALSAPSDVEKRSDGANALNAARHSISLGTIYDAVERIWAQCLWLGWWMELADGENRAVPPDRELEKHRAVGVFRYSSIATEVALRSKEFWRSLPPDQRSIRY